MEQITRFQHNVMNITDIHTFESIKGEVNDGCKDVYFVRAVGTNEAFLADIQKMDDGLLLYMNVGSAYYQRLNGLPGMQRAEDIDFYSKCYSDWLESGRKEVITHVTSQKKLPASMLSNACRKTEELYRTLNKQATDSIVKNLFVKLLFWFDVVFSDEKFHYDRKLMMKIVAPNIVKKHEYLFFYMVTLIGCDVLLLQSKVDIGAEEEKWELSTKFVLGEFADVVIPVYRRGDNKTEQSSQVDETDSIQGEQTIQEQAAVSQVSQASQEQAADSNDSKEQVGSVHEEWQLSQNQATGDNGRITIKIPERNRPSKHPAQKPQSSKMQVSAQSSVQSVASATAGATGVGENRPNPRITIPPHPGRSQSSAQSVASATADATGVGENRPNPRITIPPHPGRSQSSVQSVASATAGATEAGGSRSNSQVTIPPRSSGARPVNISTPARPVASVVVGSEVEKSFEELAMLASSVVLITVYDEKGERLGSGSGIMIGKDGYILTNNHVAAGGRSFSVRIEDDEKEYRTDEIIKYHSLLDLAIIRIQRKLSPIPVYKGSKPLVRGQKVVAIGSPLGLFNSVSDGIISGFRKIDDIDMIQFTAPISRGSSGGAVLNMQGEVIGISTAGIDAGQNINLAMGYECINMFIRGFI